MRIPSTLTLLNTCTDTGYAVCAEFATAHPGLRDSQFHKVDSNLKIILHNR